MTSQAHTPTPETASSTPAPNLSDMSSTSPVLLAFLFGFFCAADRGRFRVQSHPREGTPRLLPLHHGAWRQGGRACEPRPIRFRARTGQASGDHVLHGAPGLRRLKTTHILRARKRSTHLDNSLAPEIASRCGLKAAAFLGANVMKTSFFLALAAAFGVLVSTQTPAQAGDPACDRVTNKLRNARCHCVTENGGRVRESATPGRVIWTTGPQRAQPAIAACMQRRGFSA